VLMSRAAEFEKTALDVDDKNLQLKCFAVVSMVLKKTSNGLEEAEMKGRSFGQSKGKRRCRSERVRNSESALLKATAI
jgi:hypothetical protein